MRREAGWISAVVLVLLVAVPVAIGQVENGADATIDRKAIFLSMDGFPAELMDREWVSAYMPHLSRLIADGAVPGRSRSSFPSVTPAAHAALWSGAYGGISGITASTLLQLPPERYTILETISGFSSVPLRAEPIFASAARQGAKTIVVGAAQTYPFFRHFGNVHYSVSEREALRRNLTIFEIYAGKLGPEFLIGLHDLSPLDQRVPRALAGKRARGFRKSFRMQMEREPEHSILYGGRLEAELQGYWYDSAVGMGMDRIRLMLRLTAAGSEASPALRPQTVVLDLEADDTDFHYLYFSFFGERACILAKVFSAAPDGTDFLFYMTPPHVLLGSDEDERDRVLSHLKGLYGNGADLIYRVGALGRKIPEGGSGIAEQRYLETVMDLMARMEELWEVATREDDWNLACIYLPFPDEALHVWYGWLDLQSPAYDKRIAEALLPHLGGVLARLDRYIAKLADSVDSDDVLVLGSDHGMRGTTRTFYPNRLLYEKGLLTLDEGGGVNLNKTQAYYSGSFSITINKQARKKGVVPDSEVPELLKRISDLLQSVRDPATGQKIVSRVVTPDSREGVEFGAGSERSADLFFDVERPYNCSSLLSAPAIAAASAPYGAHGFHPDQPDMLALMVLRGPGIRWIHPKQPIAHVDIAPTVSQWLGIKPPLHATGKSLVRN
ncbi:MAG: alkaline phosphatase family protein [Acidobacteria bacterium]|nr:alkaline phosphatase family protein [Acidobacteriota bacterium]